MFASANAVHGPGGTFAGSRVGIPSSRPVSSKVSRMAASANARALAALARCNRFIRCASAWGSSGRANGMRRSTGSTRPPGKTNFPGMNLWR